MKSNADSDDLFRGQLQAVQREFNASMDTYNNIIQDAIGEQETIKERKAKGGPFADREKREMDYDYKASHYRLLSAQKQKDDLLIKMGQFAKNNDRWDAEEALAVSIQAFLRVAKKSITPSQYNKLSKAIGDKLVNKTVQEMKEFCEGNNK